MHKCCLVKSKSYLLDPAIRKMLVRVLYKKENSAFELGP